MITLKMAAHIKHETDHLMRHLIREAHSPLTLRLNEHAVRENIRDVLDRVARMAMNFWEEPK